jgi:prolyl oligopeptidase
MASPENDVALLNRLYEDYWEFILKENPTFATYLGDHRSDNWLEDVSSEAYHQRIDRFRKFLSDLKGLKKPINGEDRLNYDLFKRELSLQIEGAKYQPYLLPITQQTGPHIDLPQLITYHPFKTLQDYANYISRLTQFRRVFDQTITNLRTGIDRKIVQPRNVVEKIIPQLEAQIVSVPDKSELHKPMDKLPSEISGEAALRIASEVDDSILNYVVPAYTKLLNFLREEYLPKSRTHPGVWSIPNGRAMYAYSIRLHTTTRLTPSQIHRLGKRELARISKEIGVILRKVQFNGNLQQYNETLRKDKSNFYTTGQDLLDGFKQILQQMDARLAEFFGRLPEAKYDFREIEEWRADAAPAAYYYAPPEDRSRPGYFYVNTYKPETRPKYMMEALAYHEAVPGHHLQIAIQRELTNLPKFRRHGGYTAFVEGWALYAEFLSKQMGFYRDIIADYGRLTAEAWRASRLVVDTGIHSLKWTRDQAIEFLKNNTASSEQDIASEVDRYIAWPGQALAYKMGELKIRELRAKAERRLKRRFDIRKFHDELLNDGALPLDILQTKMGRWTTKTTSEESQGVPSGKDLKRARFHSQGSVHERSVVACLAKTLNSRALKRRR